MNCLRVVLRGVMGIKNLDFTFWGSFNKHYVYAVKVDGQTKYIGMGCGNRFKHALSGKSSCVGLNRDYFAGKKIQVMEVQSGLSKQEAVALEKEWILIQKDGLGNNLYNIRG